MVVHLSNQTRTLTPEHVPTHVPIHVPTQEPVRVTCTHTPLARMHSNAHNQTHTTYALECMHLQQHMQ